MPHVRKLIYSLLIPTLLIEQLQNDLDFLNFETKMRTLMRELIEPILNKGQKDRELIMMLQRTDDNFE